ncbi:MAG: YraN family protein [Casimicrobiaceae bacterium]
MAVPGTASAGAAAEALAAQYLAAQGLAVIARNWKMRRGEIDLIARDGATLVFVEVRLRRSAQFGGAAASITARKRARLVAAAEHYLATLPVAPPCRFDAILLDDLGSDRIEWLRDVIST